MTTGVEPAWESFCRSHLERDFGSSGKRIVRMKVMTGSKASIAYDIDHIWIREGDTCRSILFVRAPQTLRGTFVKMVEEGLSAAPLVQLKLVTSTRIVPIAPQRHSQQVLGTDFSYEDLRFWRPLSLLTPVSCEIQSERLKFQAMRAGPDAAAPEMVTARPDGEIVRFETDLPSKSRVWAVEAWAQVSPPSASLITLERLNGRFSTRMELLALHRPAPTPASLFEPDVPADRIVDHFS